MTMRRLLVLALGAALAALALAAAVDALREDDTPAPPAEAEVPMPGTGPAAVESPLAARLRRHRISGTLYLSGESCGEGPRALRRIPLPSLDEREGPEWDGCTFSLSQTGRHVNVDGAIWSRHDVFTAVTEGPLVSLSVPGGKWGTDLRGSSPAFRPDGTLTHVRGGDIVEWTSRCGPGQVPVTFADPIAPGAKCPRTILTRADLGLPGPIGPIAWLGPRLVVAAGRPGARALAIFEGRRLVRVNRGRWQRISHLRPSPDGRFLALRVDGREVAVFDSDGNFLATPSLPDAVAFDWSPDGRWLAAALPGRVYLVRTSDWQTLTRLELDTADLAWR